MSCEIANGLSFYPSTSRSAMGSKRCFLTATAMAKSVGYIENGVGFLFKQVHVERLLQRFTACPHYTTCILTRRHVTSYLYLYRLCHQGDPTNGRLARQASHRYAPATERNVALGRVRHHVRPVPSRDRTDAGAAGSVHQPTDGRMPALQSHLSSQSGFRRADELLGDLGTGRDPVAATDAAAATVGVLRGAGSATGDGTARAVQELARARRPVQADLHQGRPRTSS